MSDFTFTKNLANKWTILDPRRSLRPNDAKHTAPIVCPFCVGQEGDEQEVYRFPEVGSKVNGVLGDDRGNWLVRVIPNKFPFTKPHEVIINSPDHHKNFGELPDEQVEVILTVYKQRFQTHQDKGQVYIFHNFGEAAGESQPHPHTQLAVLPFTVGIDTPILIHSREETQETQSFIIFCPDSSQWPDEVWVYPKKRKQVYSEISDTEVKDLAFVLNRLVQLLTMRHGHEFPFNFYIYPGQDWYLRIIPRQKRLGGLEVGTGIFVNTQDPQETIAFIKEHFEEMDEQKILSSAKANYRKSV